jgi:hypothetical protein
MVTLPALAPVTITLQKPTLSEHVEGRKVTLPVPFCVKVTVPMGNGRALTIAVHMVDEPMKKEDGEQVRDVDETTRTVVVVDVVVVRVVVVDVVGANTVKMMDSDVEGSYGEPPW